VRISVRRFVEVDKVDCKKKIEHKRANKKIDCDSGGKVMVDEKELVVVDGD
jgi:hypothetical protein